jgi:Ca2+-binding RTX toxin-like protein
MPSFLRSPGSRHAELLPALQTLSQWAGGASAENDLEKIFGPRLDWATAYRLLHSLAAGDFSALPPATFLPPADMPGLWGGYSRSLRRIFLSSDCPQGLLAATFLEEVGHFFDHALCASETPGDEGAPFAAAVLGTGSTESERSAWLAEESLHPVNHGGRFVLVEAAPKNRGSGNQKDRTTGGNRTNPSTPGTTTSADGNVVYANKDSVRIAQTRPGQRLIGSQGNDTFAVTSQDVRLEDPKGGTDTVETTTSFSLRDFSFIENLAAAQGTASLTLTGNNKANSITGNGGHNRLDGGADSARDTLIGGGGNDTYAIRDSLDQVVEAANGGIDTIETTIGNYTLNFANVENVAYAGTGSATLTGNSLANVLTGGTLGDNLVGGGGSTAADTLRGGQGDDLYLVSRQSDIIEEGNGPLDGIDTIRTTAATYTMAERYTALPVSNRGQVIKLPVGHGLAVGDEVTFNLSNNQGNGLLTGTRYYVTEATGLSIKVSLEPGGNPIELVTGLNGNSSFAKASNVENLLYTGGSASRLTGNTGNNTITGGAAVRNTIDGGAGYDYIIGGNTTDSLVGGLGNDTLLANAWLDTPLGALGQSLQAGGGTDTLNGGEGNDWYVVNSQTAYTLIDPSGTDTIASTVSYSLRYNTPISSNIENLYLVGKNNLTGTGSDRSNEITGNDGNNSISAGAGNDTVYGGFGGDLVNGEAGDDRIFGGGQPQTDLPATAATAITIKAGESYTGKIDFRRDTDWIRAELNEGVTYTFELAFTPQGDSNLRQFSDAAFGQAGFDYISDPKNFPLRPYIADIGSGSRLGGGISESEGFHRDEHRNLVLDQTGARADGAMDYDYDYTPGKNGNFVNSNENVRRFSFTPFARGEFYIPISGAGPLGGSYTVTLTDSETSANPANPILADDARNTLIGGAGSDTLIAGNGRDSFGNPIGDILLGGTNGIPGGIDLDSVSGGNLDTLLGGDGGDLLDGGRGNDSMVGGNGNDTYFVDSAGDIASETDDGGQDDLAIFSHGVLRTGGAVYDIDLGERFGNIEHASLTGSANLNVLGNGDANSLHGNFGNNLLDGANGDDTLLGQGGNDYLIGGDGGDYLDGGSGQNTMDGGLGSDTYTVNDRSDRITNEASGFDGGEDLVRTYFNFDPIQGSALEQFQPDQPDNSPSVTKSPSFASMDLQSFYNLEHFELLGQAAYGVGNALDNSMSASAGASALLLGMGGSDALSGNSGNDTLYGDTPDFYASPDIFAPAPTDTRTQQFIDGIGLTLHGNDQLFGGDGDDYLDGGRGFDTMDGGAGNNIFVQDNVDDYVVATGGGVNELISSVNIAKAPDGISKLMLVVANQDASSGQSEAASFASFLGTQGANNRANTRNIGGSSFLVQSANVLELTYSPRATTVFSEGKPTNTLVVDAAQDDLDNPGKKQFDLAWTAAANALETVAGYTVEYTEKGGDGFWKTYVHGKSQDFQGNRANPRLTVKNLDPGDYEFKVTAHEIAIPALKARGIGSARHVTLQGGGGNDAVIGTRYSKDLPGDLASDRFTDPLFWNNPIDPLPLGFLFNPAPFRNGVQNPFEFATYLDGGFGNDFLDGAFVNDGSGDDYVQQGVTFKGLNTLVGGQGSDTFVVNNGGNAIGDEFDWVVKFGNETPVDYGNGGVGASLNGGQHNLVVSLVDYLTLSDTLVHQGKFIDQLNLPYSRQFGMGNRLDNFISETSLAVSSNSTLVGNTGRDSIVGTSKGNLLVGGTAYGMDNVGLAIRDFASVQDGGNNLKNSIFRDTDPVPVNPGGPGAADPGQFWFVPGFYGSVYDPNRNRDTLVSGGTNTTLDGGAGADSLVGSGPGDDEDTAARRGDTFIVSQGSGGNTSKNINAGDAVFGNGGNDTVIFTDSDYLWWSGHEEGAELDMNGYTIASDISNLVLQMGAPTARDATGNRSSTGNDHRGWFDEVGSNRITGNEFDNILNGGGVGGDANVGGFDTLTGNGGSDLFVVSGYTGASNNKWEPSITDYKEGVREIDGVEVSLAGKSEWDPSKSEYTDSDFVLITDFTPNEDFLSLAGRASDYWIGAAPSQFDTNNVRPLTGTGTPDADNFGIYRTGTYGSSAPDLVAQIKTAGGISLDVGTLAQAYTPAPSNPIPTGDKPAQYLGWGTFYKLDGATFDNGTIQFADLLTNANDFRANTQTPSTASLPDLMNRIA